MSLGQSVIFDYYWLYFWGGSSRYQTDMQKQRCRRTSNLLSISAPLQVWSPACTDGLHHSIAEEVAARARRVPPIGFVQLMIKRNAKPSCVKSILPIWRCMHRASYCNVYIRWPTRCTNSYNEYLLIIKRSTCFGLLSSSSGATFFEAVSQLV